MKWFRRIVGWGLVSLCFFGGIVNLIIEWRVFSVTFVLLALFVVGALMIERDEH